MFTNKFIIVSTALLSIGLNSQAANLGYYRKTIPELKALNETEPQDKKAKTIIGNIRKRLSSNRDLESLDFTKGPFSVATSSGRGNRLYSSFLIKNVLYDTLNSLKLQARFGDDGLLNPELSVLEVKKNKYELYQRLVIDSLLTKGAVVPIPVPKWKTSESAFRSGISIFLKLIKDTFVDKFNKSVSDTLAFDWVSGEIWPKDGDRDQKVALINSHLAAGPKTTESKTISDVLGPVVNVSTVDGYVQRLRFAKLYNGDLAVPLTGLLTYRMGEDHYFLATQEHIIQYLRRQNDLFSMRLKYLRGDPSLNKLKEYFAWEENQTLGFLKNLPNVDSASKKILDNAKEFKLNYASLFNWYDGKMASVKSFRLAYEGLYNLYYEKEAKINEPGEIEFLERRLEQIYISLPVLESKQKAAIELNLKLSQLSHSQIDYLIDLLLQLRGGDLLSPAEANIADAAFAEYYKNRAGFETEDIEKDPAKVAEKERIGVALMADIQYYAVLSKTLGLFALQMDEDNRLLQGRVADVEEIKKLPTIK